MQMSEPGQPLKQSIGGAGHYWFLASILCLVSISACTGSKIAVQQAQVAQSWQSSVYAGSEEYCFMVKPRAQGDWDYFHSGSEPDASGYQWLLIKLANPVKLVSVTVFARSGEEVSGRVVGTEVLVFSDQMPAGVLQSRVKSRCLASLGKFSTDEAAGISKCGRVGAADANSLKLDFACYQTDCAKLTRFILVRRPVRSAADKMLNFVGLDIEEGQSAEFLTCSVKFGKTGDCSRNGVYRLRTGRALELVKACLPCQVTGDEAPSCLVTQPQTHDVNSLQMVPIRKPQAEFLFMLTECPQCRLRCSYRCSDRPGTPRSILDTIQFHEPPRAVRLLFGDTTTVEEQQRFWPAEQLKTITFFTESAFPKPEHSCVLTGQCPASGTELIPSQSEILQSGTSSSGVLTFSLSSKYQLFANASVDKCVIKCDSRPQGSDQTQSVPRQADVPQLVYKCNTKFQLPPRDSWVEGTVLDVTVDSSENNPVPTSHACYLRTAFKNVQLSVYRAEAKSSTYQLIATRKWGRQVAIVCQVNQSGLQVQSGVQHPLPDVIYKAQARISSCLADQASIRITVVTIGGTPTPNCVLCSVGKDSKSNPVNASSVTISSLNSLTWSFDPIVVQVKPTDRNIFCTVHQIGQVRFKSEHNSTLDTASACEAGGINIWKVGLIIIAVTVAGPFLFGCLRSLFRRFYRKLTRHRRDSWSPSQVLMATYSRDQNSVDLVCPSELGANYSRAASTCNTMMEHDSMRRRREFNEQEERAACPEVIYDKVLALGSGTEELNKSAASLATEYTKIVKSKA